MTKQLSFFFTLFVALSSIGWVLVRGFSCWGTESREDSMGFPLLLQANSPFRSTKAFVYLILSSQYLREGEGERERASAPCFTDEKLNCITDKPKVIQPLQ